MREAAVSDGARERAENREAGEKGRKLGVASTGDTFVGVLMRSFNDWPDGMELRGPEYADRGEAYESMKESRPTLATVGLRSRLDVRTLRLEVSRDATLRTGDGVVGVITICLLRVDFSDVGVLLCDSVR